MDETPIKVGGGTRAILMCLQAEFCTYYLKIKNRVPKLSGFCQQADETTKRKMQNRNIQITKLV